MITVHATTNPEICSETPRKKPRITNLKFLHTLHETSLHKKEKGNEGEGGGGGRRYKTFHM